ncbi:MAG: folylpolyglutamate synthase/dihydrofolate synthase family protein [Blastocatellia bacterium]|nr:folylpolyglutamate synthase/dihydrofolate synthase family protein [Blastocatellia bacterium]
MNFDQSLHYLYSLGNELLAMKLGLESVRALAEAFDRPQERFPAVHIAGTNGKGSTSAMVEAIALAAGVRAGLYTSPHLVSITERVRVDGTAISEAEFARLATRVREAGERLVASGRLSAVPTFFEQATMIAYLHFAEREVELAILEVGLGGRLDATNVCRPVLTAITPVDYDHQQYLGDTLAAIAGEKAGILKSGVPVVVAPQAAEAMAVIVDRSRETGAPLIAVEARLREAAVVPVDEPHDRWQAGIHRLRYDGADVRINLRGRHQAVNAMTAILLAEGLRERGYSIPREAIVAGLERVTWPGRLEMVSMGASAPPLLLDGAHNPAGSVVLRDFLREHCSRAPLTMIFGAMADKAVDEMAAILFPLARRVILTRVDNPRAVDPARIAAPDDRLVHAENVRGALDEAMRVTPVDGLICVCGSLCLVGEVRRIMGEAS